MPNARGQGRKPKPTAAKIRNGSAAHNPQRLNCNEPAALPDEPVCPDYLDDVERKAWLAVADQMREMGYLSRSYQQILDLYAEAYATYRKAAAAVEKDGHVLIDRRGKMKRNPMVTVLHQSRACLLKMLAEFGLTPSSKTRVVGDGPMELDPIAEILNHRQAWN